ncbi:hypothetical protein F3B42_14410 [Bacteroides ovatus]|jgi:hypothetical protein|nr:hypothetical protein F3B42_14410 [Bacteroides ovatus]KAA4680775.1 hypothetical protein F3B41_15700 [Bacteroides ovatus]
MKKLQKIDEISLPDHSFLSDEDECYFILSYTSHKSFDYSIDNSTIMNLKKTVDKKGTLSYKYKDAAIEKCAKYLKDIDIQSVFTDEITLVPIPPSKCKNDPLYDDRLVKILKTAFGDTIDIKELIIQRNSAEASHLTESRPTIQQIKSNYEVDNKISDNVKDTIILFDDVLTTGTHYIAAKEILNEKFPNKKIKGIFIARRVFEKNEDDFEDFDWLKLTTK